MIPAKSFGVFVPEGAHPDREAHSERRVDLWTEAKIHVRAELCSVPLRGDWPFGLRLQGTAQLGGLAATLTFRTPAATRRDGPLVSRASAVLIPKDHGIDLRSDPTPVSLPGDSPLWFRLVNDHGHPLTALHVAGRASEGFRIDTEVVVPAEVIAWFAVENPRHPAGPQIRVRGDLRLPHRVRMRLQPLTDPNPTSTPPSFELDVVPGGLSIPFAEHSVAGESGPMPSVSVWLSNGGGVPVSGEVSLGRCVGPDVLRAPLRANTGVARYLTDWGFRLW